MPPRGKSIAELRLELQAKEHRLAKLYSMRKKIEKQLRKIDRQIGGLTGGVEATAKVAVGGQRRRASGKPLAEYLVAILEKASAPMRVKDVMTAASKAGYKSHSKDFYTIVATALRDPKRFARVGRGQYKLKA